jgi:hypothetical protein
LACRSHRHCPADEQREVQEARREQLCQLWRRELRRLLHL